MRPLAAAVAAFGLALLVAACGTGSPGVALLPASGASGHAWRWTAECPVGPAVGAGGSAAGAGGSAAGAVGSAVGAGCRKAGPILGFAQVNGDEWNLGGTASSGALDMSVSPHGAVTIDGRFASAPPCTDQACLSPSAYTWVRGYPDVSYGIGQCHASTSPRESPQLPLPMRLDSIPAKLIGVTAYAADTSGVTYDVAYDLWLHQTGTKRPCLSDGTLEIMVWTDYDARALLPPSLQVGTASIPVAVDGVVRPGRQAWSVYASNIYRSGRTAPWGGTLWFVGGQADVVGHGRVSVDLSAVFSAARLLLRRDYGWPDIGRRYWLDTAPFGVEFGPASGGPTDSGPARFSVRISAYCLDVRSTLPGATCG